MANPENQCGDLLRQYEQLQPEMYATIASAPFGTPESSATMASMVAVTARDEVLANLSLSIRTIGDVFVSPGEPSGRHLRACSTGKRFARFAMRYFGPVCDAQSLAAGLRANLLRRGISRMSSFPVI